MSDSDKAQPRLNPVARLVRWGLLGSRPQFHTAFWVLFWGAIAVPMAWMGTLIRRAFGEQVTVNYELLALFVGPLGLGALVSCCYDFAAGVRASPWIGSAVFGGVSTYSFWFLLELKSGSTFDPVIGGSFFTGGALTFFLMRWLILREQSGRAVSSQR